MKNKSKHYDTDNRMLDMFCVSNILIILIMAKGTIIITYGYEVSEIP